MNKHIQRKHIVYSLLFFFLLVLVAGLFVVFVFLMEQTPVNETRSVLYVLLLCLSLLPVCLFFFGEGMNKRIPKELPSVLFVICFCDCVCCRFVCCFF